MNKEPQQNNNIQATSQGLRVLPIVVLAAVLLYFAIQVYNYFSDPLTTTLVYESQAEDVVSLDGWLVRDEETLPAQSGTVSHALEEGQKVGAGQTVATVYAEASALQTVSRIETLKLQLQQLEFALTSYLDPDAALKLDTSITGDILTTPVRRRFKVRSNPWRVSWPSWKAPCPARCGSRPRPPAHIPPCATAMRRY